MAERLNMAEGTPTEASQPVGEAAQTGGMTPNEVLANASLADRERVQSAKKLLGTQLTPGQAKAILEAHQVGLGEPGKDSSGAGVYNYTQVQLLHKTRILREAGFSEEQRRVLLQSGIAGRLPSAEFTTFDPKVYANDPKLSRIAGKIKATGDAGLADEGFLHKTSVLVRRLDDEAEVDGVGAQAILNNLEGWQARADDSLLPYAERVRIEQQASREGASEFNIAKLRYIYYMEHPTPSDPMLQQELQNRRDAARAEIQALIQQADQRGILADVRKRALDFYKQVKATKRFEKWGRDKQQIIDQARRGYEELFWDNSPQLKQLEGHFRGVARYIWDGIVAEVDKEVNHEESPPLNAVAAVEFESLREQRRLARLTEKKYATHEYYGSRNWELTAENAEELIPSALDWVRDQIAELSNTDVNTLNRQLEGIREIGVKILETCRVRLEAEENQDVAETNPYFLRAKALIEAVADVLGNEKVLYKGGEEIGPQYKERFASNFIDHHNAIYLENPKVAYILHRLTTHRNGTYWLGQPLDSEKFSEGEIADYRRMIEEEILEDAATHDLFITEEDFRNRRIIDSNGQERDLSYSFDDNIEKLLLDPGDQIRQQIVARGDAAALSRHDRRVGVFRRIKERLDQKDRLAGITPQDRQNKIRFRILQKMKEKTKISHLARLSEETLQKIANARASGDLKAYDQFMWDWVREYNDYRIKLRLPRWYPSGWDRVRIKIDRPTKVLDRALSPEELEAMFEPITLPQTYSYNDVNIRRQIDDARFGFQLARSYSIFQMQDAMLGGMRTRLVDIKTGLYTGRLPDDEASRLLGLIDAQGNVTNSKQKIIRLFDIVQARLEDAIAKEAADIDKAKAAKAQALQSGNPDAIKTTTEVLRDLLVNSQFLATHALKEIGLVEGKLPVWSYNFLDEATLDVFMKTLADYGVEEAPGIPISHNNKKTFYEIMERGRRGLKAEWDRVAQEHMAGRYPVFARNPDGSLSTVRAMSLWRASNDFGDPEEMEERYRMINKGALSEDRKIVDTRFETSTSGGVAVPELIPTLGDLGFYPLLVWLGVTDIRSLHGYIARRDEVEFHHHKFFDVMDPVQHAKAQAAAYITRRALVGGKIGEGKSTPITPGLLKEPFHGAFKSADWLHGQHSLALTYGMSNTSDYLALMQKYREADKAYSQFVAEWSGSIDSQTTGNDNLRIQITKKLTGQDLERLRQLSYLDLDIMNKPMVDEFYTTMYGILDYFQDYLKACKDVESNRRGRAPRNWEENNHLRWYAFRRAMREAMMRPDPKKGFIMRLGYSPEVASEIAIKMMETALMDADYLILRQYEVDRRVDDGEEILFKVLNDQEKQAGFVIPDEREWTNLRPEVQKALKTIRRRGLLEFMREEGYKIYKRGDKGEILLDPKTGSRDYFKEILGKKIPPLVQEIKVKQDNRRVASD